MAATRRGYQKADGMAQSILIFTILQRSEWTESDAEALRSAVSNSTLTLPRWVWDHVQQNTIKRTA